jgi:hypothetical protein
MLESRPMILRHLQVFLLVVMGLLVFTKVSEATTVEGQTLDSLVSRSSLIVEGTVVGVRTDWSADRRLILTTTTLQVGESIKGRAPRTVDITTIGGRIGRTTMHVAGMPVFRTGENAIVFIEPSKGYLTVFGLAQGKFTVTNGLVWNSVADLSTPAGQPLSVEKIPIQSFKSKIYSILERSR